MIKILDLCPSNTELCCLFPMYLSGKTTTGHDEISKYCQPHTVTVFRDQTVIGWNKILKSFICRSGLMPKKNHTDETKTTKGNKIDNSGQDKIQWESMSSLFHSERK